MSASTSSKAWTLKSFHEQLTEDEGDCWLWLRSMGGPKRSTPTMWFKGRTIPAYTVSWLLLKGLDEMPEGLQLWRRCMNMRCVNPQCLLTGTAAKRMAWLTEHGAYKASPARRAAITVAARAGSMKLTGGMAEARRIRESGDEAKVVAARHGISVSQVSRIRNFKAWNESVIPSASIFSMGCAQ